MTPERAISIMEDSLTSELARLRVCPMENEKQRNDLIREVKAVTGCMFHVVNLQLWLETHPEEPYANAG